MAEAGAAGVPPHRFWDYTPHDAYFLMQGAQLAARRQLKAHLFGAWHVAVFERQKKIKPLAELLRRLEPLRDMSHKAIREAVLAMARNMGAKVVIKKRAKE